MEDRRSCDLSNLLIVEAEVEGEVRGQELEGVRVVLRERPSSCCWSIPSVSLWAA